MVYYIEELRTLTRESLITLILHLQNQVIRYERKYRKSLNGDNDENLKGMKKDKELSYLQERLKDL